MNRQLHRRSQGARSRSLRLIGLLLVAALSAASPSAQERVPKADPFSDVIAALAALPDARVLDSAPDGLPRHIVGDLAHVDGVLLKDPATAESALRIVLARVVAPLRLTPSDLRLRRVRRDGRGGTHFRFGQVVGGLDVIGGDLVVHVDRKGSVSGVSGGGGVGRLPPARLTPAEATARVFSDRRFAGLRLAAARLVFLVTPRGTRHRALEMLAVGVRGQDPVRDRVYVDLTSGSVVAVDPQVRSARSRRVYSANNGTSLPGTLRRSEGTAATGDPDIDGAYDNTGAFYDAFAGFWGRDSFDNAGALLSSSVHYSTNYCNAFWDGTQMVFGDGSAPSCLPLARAVDVTAHELTHAIIERESGLIFSGESGAINESLADSFAAFVEAWVAGGGTNALTTSTNTWLFGEGAIPPFVRSMCDPAADGSSADVWSGTVGNLDVHYSSGVGSLAFCLLANGGTHPRGKTSVLVPSIGLETAIRILYEAQANYMTSTTTYAAARTAMEDAATGLGYDQATRDAVGCAWAAVRVGTAPAICPDPVPPPPSDGTLQNNVPVTGLSGATGEKRYWSLEVPAGQSSLSFTISGGTGDADLYVRTGSKPTLTSYYCRPYLNGNNETCAFVNPVAGTWWAMLNGYAAYTGVSLTARYANGPSGGGDPLLTNGVPKTGLAGATGSKSYWRIATPAGKTLTVKISGGTGDADLYVRFGSRPTTTTYACRPYLNGNSETCTFPNTSAGDYYIMVRGYASYSGVSLIGSF